jgi:hypothetical protein
MHGDSGGNRNPQPLRRKQMQWRVNLTIRKMGMQCQSCKQDFETVVTACSAEMAVRLAKEYSGANQETHQFSINYVRSLQ